MEPHKLMIGDLKSQEKELTDDINNLSKKVHECILLRAKSFILLPILGQIP
jgi:hypothetical protein